LRCRVLPRESASNDLRCDLRCDLNPKPLWRLGGYAVRFIGAALDAPHISEFIGVGVTLFDPSMRQVAQRGLDTDFFFSTPGSRNNAHFVNTVFRNVVGTLPSAADHDFFVSLLRGSGAAAVGARERPPEGCFSGRRVG
jgi:hypothetical protein